MIICAYMSFYAIIFSKWLHEAKRISLPQEAKEFRLDVLEAEISDLEKNLSTSGGRVGFCHNDLQYGNIMMDEETRSITIIVSFKLCLL